MTISRIRVCQRYKVLLLHFQLDWTANDLNFCSRTTVLSWLLKIWSSASAPPLCGDCQRSEVTLSHCLDYQWCEVPHPHLHSALTTHDVKRVPFRTSALPILPKMWSSAFALPSCLDCQRYEIQLPHFCSARTSIDLKLRFHTRSALIGNDMKFGFPNFCSARTSTDLKFRFRTCSTRTSKDVKVHFRISSLPGLPKMWSSASALLLCLGCHRFEVLSR